MRRTRPARRARAATRGRRSPVSVLDPASLQVLISRLTGVAEEMGAVLRRAAYSPNIKERADCSAALFTADGELLVQAEHIPVHLGSMPAAVRAAIDGARGRPRDRASRSCVNDPFAGGTHLNDITLVAPVFTGDVRSRRLGREPGPPRRSRRDGAGLDAARRDRDLPGGTADPARPLDARGRGADRRRARARPTSGAATSTRSSARTSSASSGSRRSSTSSAVPTCSQEIVDYGERRMRAALGAPARRRLSSSTTCSTPPGRVPTQQTPARIVVRVVIDGDAHHVRLHGHRPAAAGERERGRGRDGQRGRVRAALGRRIPTIPANGGAMRPVHVIAPPGSIVAAQAPVARRRGQRRGEPARRRRVPGCARAGGARAGRRGAARGR